MGTAGTAVPTYFSSGFQKTEVTNLGRGVASGVILGFTTLVALPAGTHDVLKLKLSIRKVGGINPTLTYLNGQQCAVNQPVENLVSDFCGNKGTPALLSLNLTRPAGGAGFNTPIGNDVDVCLRSNVWVTYANIAVPMTTTLVPSNPTNFKLQTGVPLVSWKLGPSGLYPPGVTVHFRAPQTWTIAQVLAAQLWHKPGGVGPWLVVPTTNNTCTYFVSGTVSGFSDFAIGMDPELVGFRRGDANTDGRVDISDGIFILGCQFLGSACSPCPDAADSNDDGGVDIGDAIKIFSYQFSGGSPPPLPGPTLYGLDPTPDGLAECSYPVSVDEDADEE